MTECLKQQKLSSYYCQDHKPETQVWAEWMSLCMAVFSLKPHMIFSLCVLIASVSFCIQNCSYKDICQNGLGSTPMTIWKRAVRWVGVHSNDNLNLLFKGFISNCSYVLWGWSLGPQQSFREICNLAHDKGSPV